MALLFQFEITGLFYLKMKIGDCKLTGIVD
jgi:hypothetical protein